MIQTYRPFAGALLAFLLLPQGLAAQEAAPATATAAPAGTADAQGIGPVRDQPLELLVGKLPLPFKYRVVSDEVSFSTSFGLTVGQRLEFVPVDGPRAGKTMVLSVRYVVPGSKESAVVQAVVQHESEELAADPRTRVIKPVRVAGFDFTAADTKDEFDDTEQRMIRLIGQVNGNLANLFLNDPLDPDGISDLVDVLPGLQIDYTATLRFRARLDAESKRAIAGDRLHTAVGTLDEPKNIDARLSAASARRDGNGKLIGASSTFGFFKVGFWAVQSFGLLVDCTLVPPRDQADRDKRIDPFGPDDEKHRRLSRSSTSIGGLPAIKLEHELTAIGGGRSQSTRWFAESDTAAFTVRIDRMGSRSAQLKLEEQLSAMAFACKPESALLEAPPLVAPPAAPSAEAKDEAAAMPDA
jgi:hypothetical protein